MFGKKAQLLEEAEKTISQQQDQLDRYKRHYEKQQEYIEGLYDVIGDLSSARFGAAKRKPGALAEQPLPGRQQQFFS